MGWFIIIIFAIGLILQWAYFDDLKNGRLDDDANWPTNPPLYDWQKPTKTIIVEKEPKKKSWYEKRQIKKEIEKAKWDAETDAMLEAMAILDDDEDW